MAHEFTVWRCGGRPGELGDICGASQTYESGSAAAGNRVAMDPVIDYLFGIGDGHTTTWSSPADADVDADGTPDAVRLDFDGDGRIDDLMVDTDGDGHADRAGLDLDDDGMVDHWFADTGSGVWDRAVGPPAEDPGHQPHPPEPKAPVPSRGPEPRQAPPPPPDAARDVDTDGDGRPDVTLVPAEAGHPARLYVDDDGDGHPDSVLVDSDGDGWADAAYPEDASEFGRR